MNALKNALTLKEGEIYNSCGKIVFKISDWDLLSRFVILGCENGTYYINENKLTYCHLSSLENIISDLSNHEKLINFIKSNINKCYKKEYLIYILARCCAEKSNNTLRSSAYALLPELCNIPTHLFMFIELYEMINKKLYISTGWNKKQKQAISNWYLDKKPKNLLYLVTKYKNRNGWTHADVLRLTHIKKPDSVYDHIFKYITKGYEAYLTKEQKADDICYDYITSYEALKNTNNSTEAIELIQKYNFVREHIPTQLLNDREVWNALAQDMPIVAMLRNLNKLTAIGVFEKYPATLDKLVNKLMSKEDIFESNVHPLQVLISLKTYSAGTGFKGQLTWKPIIKLVSALNTAFKNAFKSVEKTGKRYLLALDVSSSMQSASVCGINCMTAAEISCAMAMIIANIEANCDIMGFCDTSFSKLNLNPSDSLDTNLTEIYNETFGATDCSLPMTWSIQNKKEYDAIIVFTDNETNTNYIKPVDALRQYRETSGINCKLIVVATSANKFTIADPGEQFNMLDIAGFSADTPTIINQFITYVPEIVKSPIKLSEPVKLAEPIKSSEPVKSAAPIKSSEPVKLAEPKESSDLLDFYETAKYIEESKNEEFYSAKLSAKKRLLKYYMKYKFPTNDNFQEKLVYCHAICKKHDIS